MAEREKRIRELADYYEANVIELAKRSIQCPSLTGEEGEVSEIYLQELKRLGYDEAFRDSWGNIIGVVHGTESGPGIMYNGHMDHVDIGDVSEWGRYDPYGGEIDIAEINNEAGDQLEMAEVIHGRAASDTKCGIACQIYSGAILAQMKKEGYGFKGDYILSAVVMEEPAEQIGMIGFYTDTLPKMGIKLDGVVSCEATALKLYLGHRGRVELQVEVQGTTSHGSAPWLGINAVNKAAALICAIEKRYEEDYKNDSWLGRSSIALTSISCQPGAMCIVPDRCRLIYDRRLVPCESPEDAIGEIQEIIDFLSKEDPDFHASVSVSAVPRTTYTGKEVTMPNIKQGWRIDKEHPFVTAAAKGLQSIGEPVGYGYWDFGTDLAVICGKYNLPALGYSPMQEYYCHRAVDQCRTDFMVRALAGNVAIFDELSKLEPEDFKLER